MMINRILILLFFTILPGQQTVEMVPYRLIPTYDIECPFEIEILRPIQVESLVSVQSEIRATSSKESCKKIYR